MQDASQVVSSRASETPKDIDLRIRKSFGILDRVAHGVINRHIRALIVSGASGCGKTYTFEKALTKAQDDGVLTFSAVSGSMSGIGLYQKLYECSDEGNVLMIDDCDKIFEDLDALNILKASLDTGKTRWVHWNKESRVLNDGDIPRSFQFNGAVVFITNIDFTREIEADKKMTPHYKALMSRSLFFDLGIRSKLEILVRIGQVIFSKEFLDDNELTKEQAKDMVAWLTVNLNRVLLLSIRTVKHLASLVKTHEDWQDMAESLLLKHVNHY